MRLPDGGEEAFVGSIPTEPPPQDAETGVTSSSDARRLARVSWGDEEVYEFVRAPLSLLLFRALFMFKPHVSSAKNQVVTDAERRVKQRAAAPSLRKADAGACLNRAALEASAQFPAG